MTGSPPRRLAAILAADIVAWSRLVRADEEGAFARLTALRRELVDPTIAHRGGRVVKLMGDGMLVEFASAVDAVRVAIEMQEAMARRSVDVPAAHRLVFRIGVNLGDVIVDESDIYGDGVNVATRLEEKAPEGGLCVSDSVHEQVRDRLSTPFEDMGALALKNIDRPVRAWSWLPGSATRSSIRVLEGALQLPDKPSIAVLAFTNMSPDPEQEFFADGIAEDIITALSRIEQFFVVARNSSFSYKGRAVDIQQVGRELGVRYVLEGSVRTAGQRLRVTAQLIDARSGTHVWAEKYDQEMADIFDVQDEITRNVVSSMQTQIDLAEGAAALDKPALSTWSLINRAWSLMYRMREPEISAAVASAEQAVALDPGSGRARMVLASCLWHRAWMGLSKDAPADRARAFIEAERAVRLSPRNEYARWQLGLSLLGAGRHDEAIAEMQRAIEINPNCSLAYGSLATVLNYAGQPDRAIPNNEIALRMNPRDPGNLSRFVGLAVSYWMIGRLDEAIAWARRTIREKPDFAHPHLVLIASTTEAGYTADAARALADMLCRLPNVSLADAAALPFRLTEHSERLIRSLRAAGLSKAKDA